jgi:hypothetical protein
MSETGTSAGNRLEAAGLYLREGLVRERRTLRAVAVLLALLTVGYVVGISAAAAVGAKADDGDGGGAVEWIVLGVTAFVVAASMGIALYAVAWSLALVKRRIPVFVLRRDAVGLVVEPARYGGLRRGRARGSGPAQREGERAPFVLARGDTATLSINEKWYARGKNNNKYYGLAFRTPRGEFRSTITLGATTLDLDAFRATLAAERVGLELGRLDG